MASPATTDGPPRVGPVAWEQIPEAMRKEMNISREDFEAIVARMHEREARVPSAGDPAPDFALRRLDTGGALSDEIVRLSELRGRPLALVFGSYTWPPFRIQAGRLNQIYRQHKDQVAFVCVYIQEAHPTDGWQVLMNMRDEVLHSQPTSEGERAAVAQACVLGLDFEMPMVLDKLSNEVDEAYCALPERLYVIDSGGTIAWRSGPGPWGFDVEGWCRAIEEQVETL